jgi:hypothetical protein
MSRTLEFVASEDDIRASLKTFNRDAPRFKSIARDVTRRTTYWVYDGRAELFGPAKFVGLKAMSYPAYRKARAGLTTGARFDGYHTRQALESVCGAFRPEKALHKTLLAWSEALVGPQVFDGVDVSKWRFVHFGRRTVIDWAPWSAWTRFDEEALTSVPRAPGAYIVRALALGEQPHVIRRCIGEDAEGVLDIGETEYLRTRLTDMLRAMRDPEYGKHAAGIRYALLEMNTMFPIEHLQFRYREVANKDAAYMLESELLNDYVARHFELPPLNYKFNWAAFAS